VGNGGNEKILEEDLCKPVSEFLLKQGYTVRCEVNYCDITALKENELIIIELKRNLSVELLAQAAKRQKAADLVFIAVPKPKRIIGSSKWKDICHLIRRLEMGLILVSFKGKQAFIEVPIEPIYFDRDKNKILNKKKRENIIKEINGRYFDLNVGGITRKKLVTAYRENAIFIACCLNMFGALSPKKLRILGTDNKKTTSILSENHYGWFEKVKRGMYNINDQGKEALKEYKELADYYNNKISENKQ
jgi:hypothetical protein